MGLKLFTSMKIKEYYFLTLNDFSKEGGGTIRMYSIVNTLAQKGHKITLFSNAQDYSKFHHHIQHIPIHHKVGPTKKRAFQFLLSKFSIATLNLSFIALKNKLGKALKGYEDKTIYTFEYLDNSVGYWLYKNKMIANYINDIHGISTVEFDFELQNSEGVFKKNLLKLKKHSAYELDKKVLSNSLKNIYVTDAMRRYFISLYPSLKNRDYTLLNNLVPPNAVPNNLSKEDAENLINTYHIPKDHKVILFTGSFKLTGGVIDLIKAFEKLQQKYTAITLLLVGDGYEKENCEQYVEDHHIENVIFTGSTPYEMLPYFQALSDIIVCPDTDNKFSELIIHIKYIDALLSNKIVINGDFPSVRELNKDEKLSLVFEPSNINSLSNKIEYALHNYNYLKEFYKPVSQIMLAEHSYLHKVERI